MALQTVAGYVPLDPDGNPIYHPAELDRNIMRATYGRSGAVRVGDWKLVPGAGVREWTLTDGGLFVVGTENSEQGGYFVWGTGSPMESGNFDAAVGNPYIATVILHVPDSQYGVVSSPEPYIEVYKGTAAASPTALPDSTWNVGGAEYVPGAWFRVGDVRVNTADTGAIPAGQFTSHGQHVKNSGATYVGLSTHTYADRQAGDLRFDTDTGLLWQAAPNGDWGKVKLGGEYTAIQSAAGTNLVSPTNATKVATNLVFPGQAGAVYEVGYNLRHWGGAAEDASINFTFPSGAGLMNNSLSVRSLLSGASSTSDPTFRGTFFSDPNSATIGCVGTSQGIFTRVDAVIVMGGSDGNVVLNWGQKNIGANPATLAAPSTMRAVRIA